MEDPSWTNLVKDCQGVQLPQIHCLLFNLQALFYHHHHKNRHHNNDDDYHNDDDDDWRSSSSWSPVSHGIERWPGRPHATQRCFCRGRQTFVFTYQIFKVGKPLFFKFSMSLPNINPWKIFPVQLGIAQIAIAPPSLHSNGHSGALFLGQFEQLCQITVLMAISAPKHPGKP